MDAAHLLSQLSSILINTYNPNQGLRAEAEASLQAFLNTPGSASYLLALIQSRDGITRDLRLAASLVMKNNVRDFWRTAQDRAQKLADNIAVLTRSLEDAEKEAAKAALLELLLSETDVAIRKATAETIKQVSTFDSVDKTWPQCIPVLLGAGGMTSQEPLRIYNATVGLRQIMKQYQFATGQMERRLLLNSIIQHTFPTIQALCSQIQAQNSLEAASIMHMALKIFYSATMYELPRTDGVDVVFWFNLLAFLIGKPLPDAQTGQEPINQPADDAGRISWPWWKTKKWATKIASHIFTRYGNPRSANDENQQFSTYFKDHLSLLLLQPVMGQLQMHSQGGYLTTDVHRSCLSYLNTAIELAPTYKALVPHLDYLIGSILLPGLSISLAEIESFTEDPIEYVRKEHNIMEEFMDPRVQAQNALQSLGRYRAKAALPLIIAQIESACVTYRSVPDPPNGIGGVEGCRDHRRKDGAIVAFAACVKALLDKKNKTYRPFVMSFIEQHVIPEFGSSVGFLRARACWCIEYLESYSWGDHSPAVLEAVCHGMLRGLGDQALPVQAAAACSFRVLIDARGAQDLIRPVLPQIISEYFRISKDLESDAVLSGLQAIVRVFGEEVASIAPMMIQTLLAQFHEYANAGVDDDEAQFAACEVLDTMTTVLEAVVEKPEILVSLESLLCPLIRNIISSDEGYEYLETVMIFIFYMTSGGKTISPGMMDLCGPLLLSFGVQAYPMLEAYSSQYDGQGYPLPIHFYITADPERFLNTLAPCPAAAADGYINFAGDVPVSGDVPTPLIAILLALVRKAFLEDVSEGEREAKAACSLLLSFVGSYRATQSIHALLPPILSLVLDRLYAPAAPGNRDDQRPFNNTKTMTLKIRLLEVVMACIYYNADVALQTLVSTQGPRLAGEDGLFNSLLMNLIHMEGPISMRLIVTSFASILAASRETLSMMPPEVTTNLGSMLQQCINELELMRDREWDVGVNEDEDGDGDFDYEDDDDCDFDDDIDLDDDEEEEGGVAEGDDDGEGKPGVNASIKAALRRMAVPEGGYGEEEDVENAEDESYRQILEGDANREVHRQRYIDGEPVEEEDERCSGTAMDKDDVLIFFVDAIMSKWADREYAASLQASLDPESVKGMAEIMRIAAERKAMYAAAAAESAAAAQS